MNSKQEINDLLKMYKMIGYKFPESFTDDMNHLFNYQTQHLIKYIEGLKIKEPSELVGLYKKDETRSVSIGSFGGDWYNYALSDILDYLRNK